MTQSEQPSPDQPSPKKRKKVVKKVIRKKKIVKKVVKKSTTTPTANSPAPSQNTAQAEKPTSTPQPAPDQTQTHTPETQETSDTTPRTSAAPSHHSQTAPAPDATPEQNVNAENALAPDNRGPADDSSYSNLEPWAADNNEDDQSITPPKPEDDDIIINDGGGSLFDAAVYGSPDDPDQSQYQPRTSQTQNSQSSPSIPQNAPTIKTGTKSGFAVKSTTQSQPETTPARNNLPHQASTPIKDVTGIVNALESTPRRDHNNEGDDMTDQENKDVKSGKKKKSKALRFVLTAFWFLLSFGATWGAVAYFYNNSTIPYLPEAIAAYITPAVAVLAVMGLMSLLLLGQLRIGMFLLYLIFSPITAAFGVGIYDYFKGEAAMRTAQFPENGDLLEIEPNSRTLWSDDDILFPKNLSFASRIPYNQGVKLTGMVMGPMDDQYTGLLPNDQTVNDMIYYMSDQEISRTDLLNDKVRSRGQDIQLEEGLGKRILEKADEAINAVITAHGEEGMPTTGFSVIRARHFVDPEDTKGETDPALVIAFMQNRPAPDPNHAYVVLIDAKRGHWIRVYEVTHAHLKPELVDYLNNPFISKEQNEANRKRLMEMAQAERAAEQARIREEEMKNADKPLNLNNETRGGTNEIVNIDILPKALLDSKPGNWEQVTKGMSAGKVKNILGKPAEETDTHLAYGARTNVFANEPSKKAWIVYIKNGKVTGTRAPLQETD